MIQNRWMIITILVTSLVISACGGQAEELPTAVVFPTDVIPTEALSTDAPEISATLTATPEVIFTLPPTWTLTPDATMTEVEVVETPTPFPPPNTVAVACESFQVDSERSTREFVIGESPVAAWTSVEGAVLYHVFLFDFNSKIINDQIYTDETFWYFDPNHFELGQNYVWAAWPLDSIGDQMCYERGLDLLPQRVPVGG